MQLVVGLGNPGPQYAGHRHNVGFMVVDRLAERHGRDPFRDKFSAQFARAQQERADFGLLKPQTYMNLSGQSVQKAMAFFKIELAQVVVIHDELDLAFGTLRVKVGGGTAGHNGLKSIVQCCGGPGFVRVRVGIGRPRASGEKHVLSDFSREECAELPDVLESAARAVGDILLLGPSAAMNRHNQSIQADPCSGPTGAQSPKGKS